MAICVLQMSNSCFAFALVHSDRLKLTFGCIVHAHILGYLADEEAELHWQPVTGLPEPLTAKACSSSRAAPVHSQLEKQVCRSCSFPLRIR